MDIEDGHDTIRCTRSTTIFRRICFKVNCETFLAVSQDSQATVNRSLHDEGISLSSMIFNVFPMSDSELDEIVKNIKEYFPHSAYRITLGILCSMGYHAQEWRVKESLRRVDIEEMLMSSRQLQIFIVENTVSVNGPSALCHVDTNRKLIRYNMLLLFPL